MSIAQCAKPDRRSQGKLRRPDLSPEKRQRMAIEAISKSRKVTDIARENTTSRKLVYQQRNVAEEALKKAFEPKEDPPLFYLPVTSQWLKQLILVLVLCCHSSYSGVIEFFRDLLDLPLAKSSIHDLLQSVLGTATKINTQQELSAVRVGAHDEIFQGSKPVLVGVDADSTYCYLLSEEESRDATTWGVRLLERATLHPDYTVADFGKGLRAGQREAWPDIPCHGDLFHVLLDFQKVLTFCEHRAYRAIQIEWKLERKMSQAKRKKKGQKYGRCLGHARATAKQDIALFDDLSTLMNWLHHDILALGGEDRSTRNELFDFVVAELKERESSCHRIKPIRAVLENQREALLAFVDKLDRKISELADTHGVEVYWVRELFKLQEIPQEDPSYWRKAGRLIEHLGHRYHELEQALLLLKRETVRASSVIENLNSRLRNYFFLRKHLSAAYLQLLQFYLNHRRYMRSRKPERVGKSPKELLTKEEHPHWLELLGFKPFKHQPKAA